MQTLSAAGSGVAEAADGGDLGHRLPDLLGQERDDRMEQAAEPVEDRRQDALGDRAGRRGRGAAP